jgi:hypothetical protein
LGDGQYHAADQCWPLGHQDYQKHDGYWFPLFSPMLAGAITLTTTPQPIYTSGPAGRAAEVTVIAADSSGLTKALIRSGSVTPVIADTVTSGTAINLSVVGNTICAAVASGTLDVKYTVLRTV